ncbi:DnaJ C-terminal domain-containing protein [Paraliomyxa miuraensis]|uniref:DnaJ C-terminal domain-containing protein n=1 Tax=Paraliomyxa miuraensis TaxID=376150 RepID=UPI002251C022|nr:DnaJ C-terminal domain-containing protein [Paraliomyxa miuraensis]
MKDLYQHLGVSRTASADEIKKAYRKLTRQYHPDRNPGDAEAEERFKDVSTAYEVLGDADKRTLYDEFGEVSLTQGFDPDKARAYARARQGGFGGFGGGFGSEAGFSDFGEARATSFEDLLSALFRGGPGPGGAPRRPTARRGADVSGEITVSLMDALHGVSVPLRIDMGGQARTLDVKVPQGVPDGGKLRLRGQGGPGQPAGDVILTVHVRPHEHMRREGHDLHLRLPVSAYEAYRGGAIESVPTPWGPVTLKLPAGAQNGQKLRLRGKGVQVPGRDAGDLYITLDVRMPAGGNERLLEVLRQAQEHEQVRASMHL